MKFHVLTLFPEIPKAFFETSIMAKAVEKEIISYNLVNIRNFADDVRKTCDDTPYGGGAGMLMLPKPLDAALKATIGKPPKAFDGKKGARGKKRKTRVIYLSPSGKPLTQKLAESLSKEEELVFICGRYEGIDQRIVDKWVDDEVSIGDYVLSSGEIACTVVIDAVYRLVEGVISSESLVEESFSDGLLEYPHYTKPDVFDGMTVPEVLLSGHHENIRKWRLKKRLLKTLKNRPDLIHQARVNGTLDDEAEKLLLDVLGDNSGYY